MINAVVLLHRFSWTPWSVTCRRLLIIASVATLLAVTAIVAPGIVGSAVIIITVIVIAISKRLARRRGFLNKIVVYFYA